MQVLELCILWEAKVSTSVLLKRGRPQICLFFRTFPVFLVRLGSIVRPVQWLKIGQVVIATKGYWNDMIDFPSLFWFPVSVLWEFHDVTTFVPSPDLWWITCYHLTFRPYLLYSVIAPWVSVFRCVMRSCHLKNVRITLSLITWYDQIISLITWYDQII